MEGNNVRLPVKGLQRDILCQACKTGIFVLAAGKDPASKSGQFPDYRAADAACAYDSNGQVLQLSSDQTAQRVIIDLGAPERLLVVPETEQDHHDRVVGYAVWSISGIAYMDPDTTCIFYINVIVSDGAGREKEDLSL